MIWQTWNDFIAMGGYAPYVWGAVGATAAGVLIEVLALRTRSAALSKGRP